MIYDNKNLEFSDITAKNSNLIPFNMFNPEYMIKPIKRKFAFNKNYKNNKSKDFYVYYDINGTNKPYHIEYKENNELIQRLVFDDFKKAISAYNAINLD